MKLKRPGNWELPGQKGALMDLGKKPGVAPDIKSLLSILGPALLITAAMWISGTFAIAWFPGW